MNEPNKTKVFNQSDVCYATLLETLLALSSQVSPDRTGTGTHRIFGVTTGFDVANYFPLLTTKRVAYKQVLTELFWFISGNTNIQPLVQNNCNIWNDWPYRYYKKVNKDSADLMSMADFIEAIKTDDDFAAFYGDLGPVYGKQWRNVQGVNGRGRIDQLNQALDLIVNDPNSRRILVNSWNPAEIPDMLDSGLPPCHYSFQYGVDTTRKDYDTLDCVVVMRSCDVFLGLPFNVASYAFLLRIMAGLATNLRGDSGKLILAGKLVFQIGNLHLYSNHVEQATKQLANDSFPPPAVLFVGEGRDFDSVSEDDIIVCDYKSNETIKAPIAV